MRGLTINRARDNARSSSLQHRRRNKISSPRGPWRISPGNSQKCRQTKLGTPSFQFFSPPATHQVAGIFLYKIFGTVMPAMKLTSLRANFSQKLSHPSSRSGPQMILECMCVEAGAVWHLTVCGHDDPVPWERNTGWW